MALCLLAGTSAFAQDSKNKPMKERPTAEQMAQRKTERMTEKLNLNETQSKQLYEVNLQSVKQMQAQAEQMRTNRKAQAEKLKSILTPEQFEQLKQMQSQRQGMKRGHGMKDGKMHEGCMMEGRNCGKPCADMDKACRKGGKPCAGKEGKKCDKPRSGKHMKEKK